MSFELGIMHLTLLSEFHRLIKLWMVGVLILAKSCDVQKGTCLCFVMWLVGLGTQLCLMFMVEYHNFQRQTHLDRHPCTRTCLFTCPDNELDMTIFALTKVPKRNNSKNMLMFWVVSYISLIYTFLHGHVHEPGKIF